MRNERRIFVVSVATIIVGLVAFIYALTAAADVLTKGDVAKIVSATKQDDNVSVTMLIMSLGGTMLMVAGSIGVAALKLRSGFNDVKDTLEDKIGDVKDIMNSRFEAVNTSISSLSTSVAGLVTRDDCAKKHGAMLEKQVALGERLTHVETVVALTRKPTEKP